jgi:hypothetical protein
MPYAASRGQAPSASVARFCCARPAGSKTKSRRELAAREPREKLADCGSGQFVAPLQIVLRCETKKDPPAKRWPRNDSGGLIHQSRNQADIGLHQSGIKVFIRSSVGYHQIISRTSATSYRPLVPPARTARSYRPLVPPARTARSYRPLVPPARAARSPRHTSRRAPQSLRVPTTRSARARTARAPSARRSRSLPSLPTRAPLTTRALAPRSLARFAPPRAR